MRIGIDISQLVYEKTGVSNYLGSLLKQILDLDSKNEYILFFSSLRRTFKPSMLGLKSIPKNAEIRQFKMPPTALDFFWNKLHIIPIESLIGDIDLFITSDWTEPPTKRAKKATFIYDLIVYKYPEETHAQTEFRLRNLNLSSNIVQTQKRRLEWVKKESDLIFTISESSKKDIEEILKIESSKIKVIYPAV